MVAMPHATSAATSVTDQHQPGSGGVGVGGGNGMDAGQFSFDDTNEELQYGPGIVSKLRCRYLSLALRQSNAKQRPALDNMRRATSLNNLLNDDDDSGVGGNGVGGINGAGRGGNDSPTVAHNYLQHSRNSWSQRPTGFEAKARTPSDDVSAPMTRSHNAATAAAAAYARPAGDATVAPGNRQCRLSQRGNDSLKRARSVEALIRYDQSAWQRDQIKDHVVESRRSATAAVVVSPTANNGSNGSKHTTNVDTVSIEDKITNGRERGEHKPKRLTSFMDETERPPPDLVKQTLRLFEATANRNPKTSLRSALNQSSDVAAKVNSFQTIIAAEKPPIVFPKPPLSPKKAAPLAAPRLTASAAGGKVKTTAAPVTLNGNAAANNKASNGCASSTALDAAHSRTPSPLTVRIDTVSYRTNRLDSPLSPAQQPRIYSPFLASPLSPIQRHSGGSSGIGTTANNKATPGSPARASPDLLKTIGGGGGGGGDIDSPLLALTKKIDAMRIDSPASADLMPAATPFAEAEISDATTSGSGSDGEQVDGSAALALRRISKSALANISKAGTTTEFKFGPKATKSPHLPSVGAGSTSTPKKPVAVARSALEGDHHHISGSSSNSSSSPLPPAVPTTPPRQIGIIRPQPKAPAVAVPSSATQHESIIAATTAGHLISPPKLAGLGNGNHSIGDPASNIDTTATTTTTTPAALTSREIEKNHINREKHLLDSDTVAAAASSSLPGSPQLMATSKWVTPRGSPMPTNPNSSAGSGTFSKPWQQTGDAHNNSMVFNFSNRKEVPDYIENDGLVVRRKRELPKPGESGYVLLGDLTLETSTDPDDSWTLGPPSPCDVTFQNDNVVIDGKSCLRRSRAAARVHGQKLKIHFNDTLTSTFEYPSESSLLLDYDDQRVGGNDDDDKGASGEGIVNDNEDDDDNDDDDDDDAAGGRVGGSSTNDGRRHQLSMGSAPLGSYTPQKVAINANFELGITRSPADVLNNGAAAADPSATGAAAAAAAAGASTSRSTNNTSGSSSQTAESLQYLKPATDEQTVAWSEGTRVTDMLF